MYGLGRNARAIAGYYQSSSDATGGVDLAWYIQDSATPYTLKSNEVLVITDVYMQTEDAGELKLLGANDGLIMAGKYAANGGIDYHPDTPYYMATFSNPSFVGPATGLKTCIARGFIIKTDAVN